MEIVGTLQIIKTHINSAPLHIKCTRNKTFTYFVKHIPKHNVSLSIYRIFWSPLATLDQWSLQATIIQTSNVSGKFKKSAHIRSSAKETFCSNTSTTSNLSKTTKRKISIWHRGSRIAAARSPFLLDPNFAETVCRLRKASVSCIMQNLTREFCRSKVRAAVVGSCSRTIFSLEILKEFAEIIVEKLRCTITSDPFLK